MIKFIVGDILNSSSQCIINPVNTEGYMGKGLAFQIGKKYKKNLSVYQERCKTNNFDIGDLIVVQEEEKYIVNFPTKRKWRENSKIEYVVSGLNKLVEVIEKYEIKSLAIPPLGAGNGKLSWKIVKEEIINFSKRVPQDVEITIYEPTPKSSGVLLNESHYFVARLIKSLAKESLSLENLTYTLFLFDKKNEYYSFSKKREGVFSEDVKKIYTELKNYCKVNNVKIDEIMEELYKRSISSTLTTKINYLNKIIEFSKNFEKEYKDLKLMNLVCMMIYILRQYNNRLHVDNFIGEIFKWNKEQKEKFSELQVREILEFLCSEKILKSEKDVYTLYSSRGIKKEKI